MLPARSIHASGSDLLALISDILDMSKIESGTVLVEVGEFAFDEVGEFVERTFRQVAEQKGLRELDAARGHFVELLRTLQATRISSTSSWRSARPRR